MTTPAVSRNLQSNTPYIQTTYTGSSASFNTKLGVCDYETRPASVNGGRLRGFKLCANWTHDGARTTRRASSERYYAAATPTHWIQNTGNIWDGVVLPPISNPSSNLTNKVLQKALLNLKNQDFHLGNFLAEADKTVSMVGNAASSIANQVLNFRKRFPKLWDKVKQVETGGLPRHRWCEIPNKWLELQYGWNPLMSDIYGAMQHLQKRGRFNVPYVTVHASGSDHDVVKTHHTSVSGAQCDAYWLVDHAVSCYLVFGQSSALLAELSSLGLVNPLEIVWEVTRYSFVVDWFLPIGNWLSSLTAAAGYSFITGGSSIKSKMVFTGSRVTSLSGFWKYDFISPVEFSGERNKFTRACYTSTPVPGVYVKNPLSLTHVANALSLLVQAFK